MNVDALVAAVAADEGERCGKASEMERLHLIRNHFGAVGLSVVIPKCLHRTPANTNACIDGCDVTADNFVIEEP